MGSIFLSDSLRTILLTAGRQALARRDDIRIDDLLNALLQDPLGARIAPAIAPTVTWPAPETLAEAALGLCLHIDDRLVAFERRAQRLFALGADRVLLGNYEPRHLAQAIGEMAMTSRAPFARYGLDPRAWQRALSANP